MVIAIVDFREEVAFLYRFVFENEGYRVQTYDGGEDFLARYNGSADVVIIEEMTLGLCGKELKREIQMRWDVPVIRKGAVFDQNAPPGCLAEPLSVEAAIRKIQEVTAVR